MGEFIDDLASSGGLAVVLGAVTLAAVFAVTASRRGSRRGVRVTLWALLAVSIATLLVWALLLSNPGGGAGQVNLVPLREISRGLRNLDSAYGAINIWGNIAVFVPIGALAMLLARPRWWVAVLWCAGLSLLIETVQLFTGRSSDVDDLILNTLGGAIGMGIAAAFHAVRDARTSPEPPAGT